MAFNAHRKFCYRIYHIRNLPHILQAGLCTKHHPDANPNFQSIGNAEIIGTRDEAGVRIRGYGKIGDYVPFYFTPRSIMLYNIVTGHRAPVVPKVPRADIIIVRAEINELTKLRYFFTDGQANDAITRHLSDIAQIEDIDWACIHNGDFTKTGDMDRPRRYQAEFLVHQHVPLSAVESIIVYNENAQQVVAEALAKAKTDLKIRIIPKAFF